MEKILAEIRIRLPQKNLDVLYHAIKPEIQGRRGRAESEVKLIDNTLVVKLLAGDTTSLRAAFNSCMRQIIGAQDLVEMCHRYLNR
ncbi:MAG: hypothetical protein DRO11_01585 [Methanobacteriota archaeon]|nr:MAG: hypothetical protein DRO11_01585 [Euryarchaeota archaeon]